MEKKKIEFTYGIVQDIRDLESADAALLARARAVTVDAYAPYSKFRVGAAARLANGEIVAGTNQENASFPVGICAERVLLGSASVLFPGVAIDTLAISYESDLVKSDHPISPCGMCRQALQESEIRGGKPMRLILGGQEGEIIIVDTATDLLPFAFLPTEIG
ncbi:MAG: cytidine deaminase [Chitinophagaceae bacterium]